MIRQENARKVSNKVFSLHFIHTCIAQAEEQRKKMEKDAVVLRQKLLEEQKRREEVSTYRFKVECY